MSQYGNKNNDFRTVKALIIDLRDIKIFYILTPLYTAVATAATTALVFFDSYHA